MDASNCNITINNNVQADLDMLPPESTKRRRMDGSLNAECTKKLHLNVLSDTTQNEYREPLSPLSSEYMSWVIDFLADDSEITFESCIPDVISLQQLKEPNMASLTHQHGFLHDEKKKHQQQHHQNLHQQQQPKQQPVLPLNIIPGLPIIPFQLNEFQLSLMKKHQDTNWKIDEDKVLVELHSKYGNSWALIANYLPGRTRVEVKTRYRSVYRAAKRYWTPQQDALLFQLYHENGNAWKDHIASKFPARTKHSVKARLKDLTDERREHSQYPVGSPNHLFKFYPNMIDAVLNSVSPFSSRAKSSKSRRGNQEMDDDEEDDDSINGLDNQSSTSHTFSASQSISSSNGDRDEQLHHTPTIPSVDAFNLTHPASSMSPLSQNALGGNQLGFFFSNEKTLNRKRERSAAIR